MSDIAPCLMALAHREYIRDSVPDGGRLLEWGCGGSTLWLREQLLGRADIFSCEHTEQWATKIGAAYVPVQAGQYGSPQEEFWLTDPTAYVHYPRTIGGLFDVLFVDGVVRNLCLLAAVNYLKPRGRIILHDSERSWYSVGIAPLRKIADLPVMWDYPGATLSVFGLP